MLSITAVRSKKRLSKARARPTRARARLSEEECGSQERERGSQERELGTLSLLAFRASGGVSAIAEDIGDTSDIWCHGGANLVPVRRTAKGP